MKTIERKTLEALIEKALRDKAYITRDDTVRCITGHVVPHLADLFEQWNDASRAVDDTPANEGARG